MLFSFVFIFIGVHLTTIATNNDVTFSSNQIVGEMLPNTNNVDNRGKWIITNADGSTSMLLKDTKGNISYFCESGEELNSLPIHQRTQEESNNEDCGTELKEGDSLGVYKITHYCSCSICCGKNGGKFTASGTIPTINRTIATDPNKIATGTKIIINGQEYIAEDTGSAVKENVIDIYVSSHEEAKNMGVYYTEVFLSQN